jgi:AP-4 complex subunit epsilon-1
VERPCQSDSGYVPSIQIHLLRILAVLGNSDQRTSEGMYEVLVDVMRRADTGALRITAWCGQPLMGRLPAGINVGYAIVYECVRTVTTIYPNTILLDAAASSIAR